MGVCWGGRTDGPASDQAVAAWAAWLAGYAPQARHLAFPLPPAPCCCPYPQGFAEDMLRHGISVRSFPWGEPPAPAVPL